MKTTILFCFLAAAYINVSAQGVFSNATNQVLEKVIQDYPNKFENIRGNLLRENQQAANYESSVRIPGSISCTISQSPNKKDVVSWKAELYQSGSFSGAREKYKELFSQIKNTIVKIQGEKPYILNGQFETPQEDKKFHSVVFNLLPSTGELQKVKVELSLQKLNSAWVIQIVIYDGDYKEEESVLAVQ